MGSTGITYRATQATRPERFIVHTPIVVVKEDGSIGYVAVGTELTIEVPYGPITITDDLQKADDQT